MLRNWIHEFDAALHVCGDHRIADAFERGLEPLALLGDGFLCASFLGDVPEDEDDSDDATGRVMNRRRAVRNRALVAASADQDSVVGEADDVARPHDERGWILDRLPSLLIHDVEDVHKRPPGGFIACPSG
jgi:hypothetical protein